MLIRVMKKVFEDKRYIVVSIFFALAIMFITALFNNIALLAATGWVFIFRLVISLPSVLGIVQFLYLIALAVIFGISVSLSIYQFRHSGKFSARGVGSLLIGFLGVGCASCGSLILTPLIGVAAGGFLATLPLGGGEFAILGLGILLWSTYVLARRRDNPFKQ